MHQSKNSETNIVLKISDEFNQSNDSSTQIENSEQKQHNTCIASPIKENNEFESFNKIQIIQSIGTDDNNMQNLQEQFLNQEFQQQQNQEIGFTQQQYYIQFLQYQHYLINQQQQLNQQLLCNSYQQYILQQSQQIFQQQNQNMQQQQLFPDLSNNNINDQNYQLDTNLDQIQQQPQQFINNIDDESNLKLSKQSSQQSNYSYQSSNSQEFKEIQFQQQQQQEEIQYQENRQLQEDNQEGRNVNFNNNIKTNGQGIYMNNYSPDNQWLKEFQEYPMIQKLFVQEDGNIKLDKNYFEKHNPHHTLNIFLMNQHYENQRNPSKGKSGLNMDSSKNNNNKFNTSKFHNKNKLFMNCIIKFFTQENLNQLVLPPILQLHIYNIVQSCKQSGIQYGSQKKIEKTDKFNHSHYRLLFLNLNQQSIQKIKKYEQDISLHKQIYNINLYDYNHNDISMNNFEIQNKIILINFIKRCIYEITMRYIYKEFIGTPDQWSNERLYECRAFQGIQQLIEGNCIMRF